MIGHSSIRPREASLVAASIPAVAPGDASQEEAENFEAMARRHRPQREQSFRQKDCDADVLNFLEHYGMDEFAEAVTHQLGIESVEDLRAADDAELLGIGMSAEQIAQIARGSS